MLRTCFWHSFYGIKQQENSLPDEATESISDTSLCQKRESFVDVEEH